MERLILCQGTAQLVTAIAALRHHEATSHDRSSPTFNHLLICGLAVEEAQTQAFTAVIEQMAGLLHPFTTINRLSDSTLEGLLIEAQGASSAAEIAASLKRATGIGDVEEVFAVRDWQACNLLAFSAFPNAAHICYGDSVGVYLPRGFMAGKPTAWSRIAGLLRRLLSSRSALLANPRVDISYLLLPGAFGPPPSGQVIRTDVATLRDLFTRLGPLLDSAAIKHLRSRTAGRPVWVLMGSNFSEQGMMTQEGEIAAYRAWIESLRPDPDTVLLIKSHPRDRAGKRELLEENLGGLFREVLSADSVGSAYLPIETVLLDLMPIVASLQSLTVSTACLATHFVIGSKTHIGFGEELVTKYVSADRRHNRCRHELDLRRLCAV
jgi:hypothetical protein